MKTLHTLTLIMLCALLFSCHKTSTKNVGDEILPTDVASAIIDSVTLYKSYPGTLVSMNSIDIVARVNGIIEKQWYSGGDKVKKGQVLFTIEDTQYRDAVQQAEAALANARSELAYNTKHYEALAKAYESDAVAQIQVLQSKSAMEQSQAAVKNAEAALETANTNLGYCTICAPFDGEMTNGIYSTKAYVSGAGAPVTLAKIYDNTNLFADFYIDDNSYMKSLVNPNNRSKIDYDAVPVNFQNELPHKYFGKLKYIDPSVDTSTGTLMARLTLESPYDELRNGMYCSINLPYKFEPNAIMVKDAAIQTSQTNKFLYVVNDSNRVVYTPIEVGDVVNDTMRIVTYGLKGGEMYITKALLKTRPGMEVKPILTK